MRSIPSVQFVGSVRSRAQPAGIRRRLLNGCHRPQRVTRVPLTPLREATIESKEILSVPRPLQVQGLLILEGHIIRVVCTTTEESQRISFSQRGWPEAVGQVLISKMVGILRAALAPHRPQNSQGGWPAQLSNISTFNFAAHLYMCV